MGRIYNNIVETVGHTPLVKLNKVTAGVDATILLKCEFFNPLGSVKDRIGMSMIEDAEKRGSGIAHRAFLDHFGASGVSELRFWDRSPLAMRFAEGRAKAKYPGLKGRLFGIGDGVRRHALRQ